MESPPPVPGEVAYSRADRLGWWPNGMRVALSLSEAAGTAEIGTVRPFSLHTVRLGAGVRVVGLTDSYLIGSSWRTGRDELYPLQPSGGVGTPTVWGAARDNLAGVGSAPGGPAGARDGRLRPGLSVPHAGGRGTFRPRWRGDVPLARPTVWGGSRAVASPGPIPS